MRKILTYKLKEKIDSIAFRDVVSEKAVFQYGYTATVYEYSGKIYLKTNDRMLVMKLNEIFDDALEMTDEILPSNAEILHITT